MICLFTLFVFACSLQVREYSNPSCTGDPVYNEVKVVDTGYCHFDYYDSYGYYYYAESGNYILRYYCGANTLCSSCTLDLNKTKNLCVLDGTKYRVFDASVTDPTLYQNGYYVQHYVSLGRECMYPRYTLFYPTGYYKSSELANLSCSNGHIINKWNGETLILYEPDKCYDDHIYRCSGTTMKCNGIASDDQNVCMAHGDCINSICVCDDGYFGNNCQYEGYYCDLYSYNDIEACSGNGDCVFAGGGSTVDSGYGKCECDTSLSGIDPYTCKSDMLMDYYYSGIGYGTSITLVISGFLFVFFAVFMIILMLVICFCRKKMEKNIELQTRQ